MKIIFKEENIMLQLTFNPGLTLTGFRINRPKGDSVVEWFRALDPPPYYYLDLFSVVASSTPRPRCVNSQLVSLPPVVYVYLQYLFIYFPECPPISTTVLNTLDTYIELLLLRDNFQLG